MNKPVEYLDLDDILDLAIALLGDPPPVSDIGLLASAVARPSAVAFGQDAYPDIVTKAAALLQSVVINRALVDGNKRLGWLSTAVFLEMNRVRVTQVPNDDVYELVMWVAAANPDVAKISERLSSLVIEFGAIDRS